MRLLIEVIGGFCANIQEAAKSKKIKVTMCCHEDVVEILTIAANFIEHREHCTSRITLQSFVDVKPCALLQKLPDCAALRIVVSCERVQSEARG